MSVTTIICRPAVTADELEVHARIRHAVFVDEQGLFEGTDRDEHDEGRDDERHIERDDRQHLQGSIEQHEVRRAPTVRHVVGYVDGVPAGTVRLYRIPSADPDELLWQGDRLAVLPEFRRDGVGAPLVRYAVASAGEAGGHRMIAYVQRPNVVFFKRLGWTPEGDPVEYAGEPHQRMWIGLT
jgi:GNAT superfamily N-acetyltransferase